MREELRREPSDAEVAARLGLSPRKLRIVQRAIRAHGGVREEEGGQSLADVASGKAPDAQAALAEELRRLPGLLGRLDARDADVLRMRFGLGGEEPKTLQEIGDRLGLTRERARQLELEALRKLRGLMGAD
jgi:RNA polymerase primary sigma factor